MDYLSLINKYYPTENELKRILMVHSRSVANKALQIVDAHPKLQINRDFVEAAAMLHDIGIFRCHAPGIHCYGTAPYILHGRIGAELLREEGWTEYARVCERHTGAGITKQNIIAQDLPLPHQDFLPETLEEQVICYADKFYSKTRLEEEKTYERILKSLEKFGEEGLERFQAWHKIFHL